MSRAGAGELGNLGNWKVGRHLGGVLGWNSYLAESLLDRDQRV